MKTGVPNKMAVRGAQRRCVIKRQSVNSNQSFNDNKMSKGVTEECTHVSVISVTSGLHSSQKMAHEMETISGIDGL